jgi:hypothetical protein
MAHQEALRAQTMAVRSMRRRFRDPPSAPTDEIAGGHASSMAQRTDDAAVNRNV